MKIVPIIVMGFDLEEGGKELGPWSKAYCDAAIQKYQKERENGYKPVFIISAGIATNRRKFSRQSTTMAKMMGQYLIGPGISKEYIVDESSVWGSRAEIKEAIRIIIESKWSISHIWIVSSHHHCLRLRIIYSRETWKEKKVWKYKFVSCPNNLNIPGELVKIFIEILRTVITYTFKRAFEK